MAIETLISLMGEENIPPVPARRSQASGLANPEPWLVDALTFGQKTSSGQAVSEDSALNYTAVLACIRVLSETLASLPMHVYRRLEPEGKERARGHYAYALLHDEPNPAMSAYTFKDVMMANAARWGNAYAWIDWTGAGRPRAFWPLRPDRMKVSFVNRRLVYEYDCPRRQFSGKYLAEDIIHIRTLGDDLVGYSPIRLAREAIGLGMGAAQYGGKLFANGARIGGVLQVPGRLKDKRQFEADFNAKFAAAENAHKTLVIDDGAKFVATTFPPDDAQFLETRKFSRGEVASIYRVPPHLIGDLERATNSNIEHQSLEFIKFTMLPWIVNWEQEFNRKVLGGGFHCEFLLDALERADIQSRYAAYNTGIMSGMLNQDECRAREGMNPIPGGNVHRMQMQMVPLTAPAPTEEQQ